MKIKDFDIITINRSDTVEGAMEIINTQSCKTVFLIEDGMLMGSLTDGDVRRHLLNGGSIKDKAIDIMSKSPKFFHVGDQIDYQRYMFDNKLTEIPILDSNEKVVYIESLNSYDIARKIHDNVSVIMMAGGMGSRLKPYTDIIPKPLIPIGGKTITEQIFDKFAMFGINDFYMVINYKKGIIKSYFEDLNKYTRLKFVEESFFMGTAGGISLVRKELSPDFFLINCDILVNCDYYGLYKQHIENGSVITIVAAKKQIEVPYGTLKLGDDHIVLGMQEKPKNDYYINTGMYLCNNRIYNHIGNEERVDMPTVIQRCIDAGEIVKSVIIDNDSWIDIGQLDLLGNAELKLSGWSR